MSGMGLVLNHLWQSTLFVLLAALLAVLLRNVRARVRFWIWLAASLKFLVPFSVIVLAAGQIHWRSETVRMERAWPAAMAQVSEPFPASTVAAPITVTPQRDLLPSVLFLIWAIGFLFVIGLWLRRWLDIRTIVRNGMSCGAYASLPVLSSPALLEPSVFGIFKPVLLLPQGLLGRLSGKELEAIFAHELCHVRYRDNLAAATHTLVEAVFWFHPLVWWLERRLIAEREFACDEDVLRAGSDAQDYAEGILAVCKFCLASPIACAAGVSGADLRRRIESIMSERLGRELTTPKKLLLAVTGLMAIAAPVALGLLHASATHAQEAFEVASVKPSNPAQSGSRFDYGLHKFSGTNITTKSLILNAYDLHDFQLKGGPSWLNSVRYDIQAKTDDSQLEIQDVRDLKQEQLRQFRERRRTRLQALLADRFHLKAHSISEELPIYTLVIAKDGRKFQESKNPDYRGGYSMNVGNGHMVGQELTMEDLAANLSGWSGHIVTDKTGLSGHYDLTLSWKQNEHRADPISPDVAQVAAEDSGPSLLTALQEQLGLKLVPQKGPVEVLVIDHIEKPSPN